MKKRLRHNSIISPHYHRVAKLVLRVRHLSEYREAHEWMRKFDRILAFFGGIGDDLMMTGVIRGLRDSGAKRIAVLSEYPELFEGNQDVAAVFPKRFPQFTFLDREFESKFRVLLYASRIDSDRSQPPTEHVLAVLCRQAGVTAPTLLRPFFFLREKEKQSFASVGETICVQSSNRSARYAWANKEWFPERFQKVVDCFRMRFRIVQIGAASDPLLDNVEDLRGKTTLRECAAILDTARLFIGLEGFLMHLARSVDTRSVIIYGGRLLPSQIGYPCNENICTSLACSPCWRDNLCEFDRECMRKITEKEVVNAVEKALGGARADLQTDVYGN